MRKLRLGKYQHDERNKGMKQRKQEMGQWTKKLNREREKMKVKQLTIAAMLVNMHPIYSGWSGIFFLWNKLLTTCNKLDGIIRLVARLFQQLNPIQSWYNNIVTTLCDQSCNILVIWPNTTCRQHVNRFVTTCLQTCNNLCVCTRVDLEISPVTMHQSTLVFVWLGHYKKYSYQSNYTRKPTQVVTVLQTSPFTSCRQVVFALLVPSCCNKFGTSC
jgi:hypothetical protein